MSVVFLTGDHPRHRYIANTLHKAGLLSALVIEQRENISQEPPHELSPDLQSLFKRHFQEREQAELTHFQGSAAFPNDIPVHTTDRAGLNGDETRHFLQQVECEILLSYGIHMLSEETLAASSSKYKWNIHGGLSPYYRGCITHFWPNYMLEPQMTGFTVHQLTQDLDHGPVVHQTGTQLCRGDGLHDTACRAVKILAEELPQLIRLAMKQTISATPHKTSGRIWYATDWRPEHLRLIYEFYNNRIADACLDGIISGREPSLIRQW